LLLCACVRVYVVDGVGIAALLLFAMLGLLLLVFVGFAVVVVVGIDDVDAVVDVVSVLVVVVVCVVMLVATVVVVTYAILCRVVGYDVVGGVAICGVVVWCFRWCFRRVCYPWRWLNLCWC